MDKVIIDGVDVNECPNLEILEDRITGKKTFFCNCHQDDCSEQKNCYYKQLQRAKAENEKLKKELEKHKSMIAHNLKPLFDSDFQNKLKELEHENERLKEEIKKLEDFIKSDSEIDHINHEYTYKLKQTLQEIRDIVEKLKSPHCTDCTQVLNKKGKCTGECMYDYKKVIIDKINKVIGAE